MASHLDTQFDQLQLANSLVDFNLPDGYAIVPKVHGSWKSAERRFLFILESVDSVDIRKGELFTSWINKKQEQNAMIATLRNTLKQSWKLYQEYLGVNYLTEEQARPDFSIAVSTFNAAKYFHLSGTQRANVLQACAKRSQDIVARLKPTDVIIFGDTAARYLIKTDQPDLLPFKRGWVHDTHIGDHPCKVTSTLDLEPLYNAGRKSEGGDDDDELSFGDASGIADLLYFVCRTMLNAYAGKHLHSIAHVKPKAILIDTVAKFDKFFEKLSDPANELVSYDVESAGLEAYHNAFYTQQYSFDTTKSYVVVLDHPKTPFDPEELVYIKRKLTSFWSTKKYGVRTIIGTNLQFDLKLTRALFDILTIPHRCWDVTAGESMLDENCALFDQTKWRVGEKQIKTTLGNLRNLVTHYGNDFYYQATFTKEQRNTIGHVDICRDQEALRYCAADTQFPLAIYEQQCERARRTRLFAKATFFKRYHRHVINQMSNTVHGISHMHQAGSHLDVEYMEFLTGKQSPLLQVMVDMKKEMSVMPNVLTANKLLLKEQNIQATGMFGGKSTMVFEPTKPAHKQLLYYLVMKLKPVSTTDTGQPAVDKLFFAAYAKKFKEVECLEHIQKASKLLSTYVKGWLRIVKERADSAVDHCIRPSFGFFGVITGRLNSFDPSLHQTPSRGPSAKYIKRAFTPRKGCLNWNYDYSSQEVRQWGVLAFDEALSAAFKAGQKLRQELLLSPGNAKIYTDLKQLGDLHVQNVHRFFGVWIDRATQAGEDLRSAVKAVVFGVIYGKSARTLSKDIRNDSKELASLEADEARILKALKDLTDV